MKKHTIMYKMIGLLLVAAICTVAVYAEDAAPQPAQSETEEIKMPEKGTPEYWNLRSEAIGELLPLLTKKRSEVKTTKQMLAEYLVKIGKASEFAGQNIPVPTDPNVFIDILQLRQMFPDMKVPNAKRPTWDELMSVVMRHVLVEGYLPTTVEQGDELNEFTTMCRKKEEYGQKVRQELRSNVDQCARMWVYLDSIKKLDEFKSAYAGLKLQQKLAKDQEKQMYIEQNRQAAAERAQTQKETDFQDALSRGSFQSGIRETRYQDRRDNLEYRQSLLDERFVNGGYQY